MRSSCHHAYLLVIVGLLQALNCFLDLLTRLENVSNVTWSRNGKQRTFGSKFSAIVKCFTADPFCLIALYSLPSKKCTIASSGAKSLRIINSFNAASISLIDIKSRQGRPRCQICCLREICKSLSGLLLLFENSSDTCYQHSIRWVDH